MDIQEKMAKLTQLNKELLLFLTGGKENELKEFFEKYWEDEDRQFFAVMKLKREKLEEDRGSYEEFEQEFHENPKNALERLFKHIIDNYLVKEFQENIDNGVFTLKELYDVHMRDRMLHPIRLMKILKAQK